MSEIKVGDRGKPLGYCHYILNNNNAYNFFNGEVVGIVQRALGVYVYFIIPELKGTSGINYWFCAHKKQFRKLVRVKKCPDCEGEGIVAVGSYSTKPTSGGHTNCYKCNGKGKVKV